MLTPSMIGAETISPALTTGQKLNLMILVRHAYPTYAATWDAALSGYIDAEIVTPTVKTQALKAVLTQLDVLPAEDVESQGESSSPTFFSTSVNWRSLALDILVIFNIQTAGVGSQQSWGLVQRTIADVSYPEPNWVGRRTPILKT